MIPFQGIHASSPRSFAGSLSFHQLERKKRGSKFMIDMKLEKRESLALN